MALIKGKQLADSAISTAKIADSAVTSAKLAGSIDPAKLDLSKDYAFTGVVTVSNTPSQDTHVTNKAYVDAQVQGLDIKESVVVATAGVLSVSASSSVNSSARTITLADGEGGYNQTNSTFIVDSIGISQNDRILIKDGINIAGGGLDNTVNGIYTLGAKGGATVVLTRADDSNAPAKLSPGSFCFVEKGTTNADNGFVATHDVDPTLGTTDISYTQFSSTGTVTAGDGITKTGSEISVNLDGANSGLSVGANGLKLDADNLTDATGVTVASDKVVATIGGATQDLAISTLATGIASSGLTAANGAISVNVTGSTGLELVSQAVKVKLDTANSALSLSTSGLKVALDADGSIDATSGLRAPVASVISQLAKNPTAGNTDGYDTGLTMSYTPSADAVVSVFVNGVRAHVGNGTNNGVDCYFVSPSATTTAKDIADIAASDQLRWNGSSAYALAADDLIDIVYPTFGGS